MGLFSNIIDKFKLRTVEQYFGSSSKSTPYSGEAWDQDIFRATVDCIATHAAKGQAKHVIMDANGKISRVEHNSIYARLLNIRPNPLMTGFEFKYRLFAQLETQTTAIAYIKWNGTKPEMICPVDYRHFEFKEVKGGGYAWREGTDDDYSYVASGKIYKIWLE